MLHPGDRDAFFRLDCTRSGTLANHRAPIPVIHHGDGFTFRSNNCSRLTSAEATRAKLEKRKQSKGKREKGGKGQTPVQHTKLLTRRSIHFLHRAEMLP